LEDWRALAEWGEVGEELEIAVIQTSLTNLIIYNLMALLGVLALLWVKQVVGQRLSERRRHRYRVVCSVCGQVFHDPAREMVVTCPACGRHVERQEVLDI